MPNVRTLLTTSIAVAAVAGAAGFAVGRTQGAAPPRLSPPAAEPAIPAPVMPVASVVLAPLGWDRAFADLDPALAAADRELDSLAAEMAKAETRALADGVGALAPGFEQVAAAPGGACVKSVAVTSTGDGKPPRVVARTWGNCVGVSAGAKAPSGPRAPTPELQAL